MTQHLSISTRIACLLLTFAVISTGEAQDRVYPLDGPLVAGSISAIQRDGITLVVGGQERNFATAQVKRITFNREPAPLTEARNLIADEQFESAFNQVRQLEIPKIERKDIQAEALFFYAFCQGKLALAGTGGVSKESASSNLVKFIRNFGTNWHYFEAVRLWGDLELSQGKFATAVKAFQALGQARNNDLKFESKYLVGWALLRQKKYAEAGQEFSQVVGIKASSAGQLRVQKLAKAGKAAVAAASGKPDEGLKELEALIKESDASDSTLFGRISNAQGACYSAKNDAEGAVMSYLKTHLLFQSDPEAHAEALSQLVSLWPKIGQPERGNEARATLQKLYPGR